ncbi:MAG: hypothetical protein JNK64_03175 [Myxococcales bacterium]|nr:hypothetical protein [Myxococcales bacterium]
MIDDRSPHLVGSWRFDVAGPRLTGGPPNAALARAIAALPPVAALLRAAELLIIERASARVAGRHLRIDLAAGAADPIAAALHAVTSRWWATPLCHVRFEGCGALLGPIAPRPTPGLVDLSADDLGGHSSVSVYTRCDAWLPFDLNGRPQPVLSARNAPRLRAALAAVAHALGTQGHALHSKFTRCDGYVVANRLDACDEPVDIADWGYDASWFVAPTPRRRC